VTDMIVSGVGLQNLNCKQRRQGSDLLPGALHSHAREILYNERSHRPAGVSLYKYAHEAPGALVDDEK